MAHAAKHKDALVRLGYNISGLSKEQIEAIYAARSIAFGNHALSMGHGVIGVFWRDGGIVRMAFHMKATGETLLMNDRGKILTYLTMDDKAFFKWIDPAAKGLQGPAHAASFLLP